MGSIDYLGDTRHIRQNIKHFWETVFIRINNISSIFESKIRFLSKICTIYTFAVNWVQILKSRLVDLENIKNKEKENELKGEFVSAEWGNQVRSYVLHPYTLVKDIRSGFELPDAQKVLDGDLDQLLFEFLKFINKSQNHN